MQNIAELKYGLASEPDRRSLHEISLATEKRGLFWTLVVQSKGRQCHCQGWLFRPDTAALQSLFLFVVWWSVVGTPPLDDLRVFCRNVVFDFITIVVQQL